MTTPDVSPCPHCGRDVPQPAAYCLHCGAQLTSAEAAAGGPACPSCGGRDATRLGAQREARKPGVPRASTWTRLAGLVRHSAAIPTDGSIPSDYAQLSAVVPLPAWAPPDVGIERRTWALPCGAASPVLMLGGLVLTRPWLFLLGGFLLLFAGVLWGLSYQAQEAADRIYRRSIYARVLEAWNRVHRCGTCGAAFLYPTRADDPEAEQALSGMWGQNRVSRRMRVRRSATTGEPELYLPNS